MIRRLAFATLATTLLAANAAGARGVSVQQSPGLPQALAALKGCPDDGIDLWCPGGTPATAASVKLLPGTFNVIADLSAGTVNRVVIDKIRVAFTPAGGALAELPASGTTGRRFVLPEFAGTGALRVWLDGDVTLTYAAEVTRAPSGTGTQTPTGPGTPGPTTPGTRQPATPAPTPTEAQKPPSSGETAKRAAAKKRAAARKACKKKKRKAARQRCLKRIR